MDGTRIEREALRQACLDWRMKNKCSQTELAKLVGCDRGMISRCENGKRIFPVSIVKIMNVISDRWVANR